MTLLKKRIIYSFFFLIFATATPLLIIYTAGYRYNTQRQSLQRLGLLIVKTSPSKSEIYLDANLLAQRSPARLKDLTAGDYILTVKKDGYYSWKKKISIYPQQTTFVDNVVLLKKNLPTQLLTNQLVRIWPLAEYNRALYLQQSENQQELRVLNLDQNTSQLLDNWNGTLQLASVSFSPSGKKALINKGDEKNPNYWLYTLDGSLAPVKLNSWLGPVKQITWHSQDDNRLLVITSRGLAVAEIFSKKITTLDSTPNLQEAWENNQQLITVNSGKNNYFFKYTDLNTGWQQTGNLPENLIPWGVWHDTLIFRNLEKNSVWLVNLFNTEQKQKLVANNLSWWNNDTLLINNDWEVYFYSLTDANSNLLARFSQPLKGLVKLPDNQRLALIVGSSLQVIELNDPEGKNTLTLLKAGANESLFFDQQQKNLYFLGQIGQQRGLYRLELFD